MIYLPAGRRPSRANRPASRSTPPRLVVVELGAIFGPRPERHPQHGSAHTSCLSRPHRHHAWGVAGAGAAHQCHVDRPRPLHRHHRQSPRITPYVPMDPRPRRPAAVTPDNISLLHLSRHTTARTVCSTLQQIQQSRLHSALLHRRAAWSGCTSGPPRALTPRPARWGNTTTAHTTRKMISAEA